MSYSGGIIRGNVDIRDVQRACPVTIKRTVNGVVERRNSADIGVICGGKVGNTVPDNQGGTAWTISARVPINKWAKYKPLKVRNLLRKLTEAERKAVNYGIVYIPSWGNPVYMSGFWLKGFRQEYYTNEYGQRLRNPGIPYCGITDGEYWGYERPTGGTYPYRITDFAHPDSTPNADGTNTNTLVGYNRNAVPPIRPLDKTDLEITPYGELTLFAQNVLSVDGSIMYSDLKYVDSSQNPTQLDISTFYFGVMLCKASETSDWRSGTNVYGMTMSTQVGDLTQQGMGITMRFATKAAADLFASESGVEYLLAPFVSNNSTPNWTQGSANFNGDKFIALHEPQTVTIRERYVHIGIQSGSFTVYTNNGLSTRLVSFRFIAQNLDFDEALPFTMLVEVYDAQGVVIGTGTYGNATLQIPTGGSLVVYDPDGALVHHCTIDIGTDTPATARVTVTIGDTILLRGPAQYDFCNVTTNPYDGGSSPTPDLSA